MDDYKPMLTISEQIEHLEAKGVRFEIMNKDEAADYLAYGNNYFKVASYRKNYPKHPGGVNEGKYINLDFAYLVDLAVIDMRLRYRIVHMALDIEHHTKLRLMRAVEEAGEDGYQIVQDFIDSISDEQKKILKAEIHRNEGNVYCGDIIRKYDDRYPIWAFLEIIPFGRMLSLYGFCAKRFENKEMKREFFTLRTCRAIRNASAHSNCILNDLRSKSAVRGVDGRINNSLDEISELRPNFRRNRMSNARIQQIVSLFYMYNHMVLSSGLRDYESRELHIVTDRMFKHEEYYKSNPLVLNSFSFLKTVVDNWF